MKNVDGAGTALTDIAKGLQSFADLENPAAIAKSIESIFTSIGDTFAKYYKDTEFRDDLNHMQGFITELSTYAQDGSLAKAATDIQSISTAINSIDAYKADSLGNLFKSAGELSSNKEAYMKLADAVEEIRDILGSQGSSIGDAITGAFGGGGDEKGKTDNKPQNGALNRSMNKINSTLSQLNSTMKSLPVSISNLIPDEG